MSHITQHIKIKRSITITGLSAIFILLLLTLSTLLPLDWSENITEAVTGSATLSETSLTMTSSSTTASVDLSVLKDNGTFASSANPIKFEVKTTNYSGYTISLSGSSDKLTNTTANGSYTNDSDKYATLSSISTSIDTNTFKADSDASTAYNGKFGISPSKYKSGNAIVNNTSDNATYLPAPTSAITLDETTSANPTAINYTIGLGARASYTQAAGTYVGTYKLTAVGNPINYVLTYDKNTTDTVADVPSNKSDSTSQTTITLDSKEPTREGYTFLGWCLGTITTTSNVDSCTGTTYQPGASFGIDQTTENKPTLKAMWEIDAINMQGLSSGQCTTAASEVVDSRDGQKYTIQRLADGKCWLLDNLALGATELKETLSTSNTNMSPSVSFTLPSSISSGFNSYTAAQINTASYTKTGSGGYESGKYGVYYNYCAASAGTYCMASGYGSGNASYDICPKGWRMPTGGSSGEYQALYNKYGSYSIFVNALRTPLPGRFANSSALYQGSGGLFWSSTYSDASGMYILYVTASVVFPANTLRRDNGSSVRCVLDESIKSATYIQDVTADMVANTAEGMTASLTDIRDGQIYTTAKIGNLLWMTRNLAIGCDGSGSTYSPTIKSVSLTSSDSNVSSTWSTPTTSLASGSVYSDPRIACNATYGAYYNYAAATAGTITGDSNSAEASYSVCPKGWRLPTHAELGTIGTSSGSTTHVSAFSPVYSGVHYGGKLTNTGIRGAGYWWSSTANNATLRCRLYYASDKLYSDSLNERTYGFSIRCVHP